MKWISDFWSWLTHSGIQVVGEEHDLLLEDEAWDKQHPEERRAYLRGQAKGALERGLGRHMTAIIYGEEAVREAEAELANKPPLNSH